MNSFLYRNRRVILASTTSLVVIVGSTVIFAEWVTNHLKSPDPALTIVTFLLVMVGGVYAFFSLLTWNKIAAQVKTQAQHSLAALSNDKNWKLLTYQISSTGCPVPPLPPIVDSWENLSTDGWQWRVLHFNSMNLVRLAWEGWETGVFMDENEIRDWIVKARFLFACSFSSEPRHAEGKRQLQTMLRKKEGYPDAFYAWLVKHDIVPSGFVPERESNP